MKILSAFNENPTEYIHFADQEPGERIIFLLRQHPITNIPWILTVFVLLALPTIMQAILRMSGFELPEGFDLVTGFIFYLFTVIYAFESFLNWYFNVYIVTDRRIVDIDFHAFFYRRVSEAPWQNIEDTTYTQGGIFQAIFNYGDVFVQTAGKKREFDFHNIPNPHRVHDKVSDLVSEHRINRR